MGRFYEIDGKKLPSVTTLIPGPHLERWAANCAVDYMVAHWNEWTPGNTSVPDAARTAFEKESQKARKIGSAVHRYCERFLRETKPSS